MKIRNERRVIRAMLLVGLLVLGAPAHAQLGFFVQGALSALPNVLSRIGNKLLNSDPSKYDIDANASRAHFEESIKDQPPEVQARMRAQFEQAMNGAQTMANMGKAQAIANRDAPLLDPAQMLGDFLGGAVGHTAMLGQAGLAAKIAPLAGTTNIGGFNVSNAGLGGGPVDLVGIAQSAAKTVATSAVGAATPATGAGGVHIGSSISPAIVPVGAGVIAANTGAAPSFWATSIAGIDASEGTREQVVAALNQLGIIAAPAMPGLADVAIVLQKPDLDDKPASIKVGYEPATGKIALLSHNYAGADDARFGSYTKALVKQFGQPTSREDGTQLVYEWALTEKSVLILSRNGGDVAVAYHHRERMQPMVAEINRRTAPAPVTTAAQ